MLPFLDLSVIRENPKVFLGYSDTTITHFAFLSAGVTSFYGPSIMAGFDENGGLPPYMAESVRQVLFAPAPCLSISPNHDGWTSASWEWGDEKRNQKKRKLQPCSGWRWLQGTGQHRGPLDRRLPGGHRLASRHPDLAWAGCAAEQHTVPLRYQRISHLP
jgi:muramoyltetrapeptide carboxypeptidase LdcA involved in peptidoglycan recycling